MAENNVPQGVPPKIGYIERFEQAALCTMLTTMILLACLQITLRTFFGSGLLWADPLLRYLVLWSGLLGAVMATSKGNHIALDLAGYLIPKQYRPFVQMVCHLFSCVTAGFLTWAAILFIHSEKEFSVPGLFEFPSWIWMLIFPLAFALMSFRYLILFFRLGIRVMRYHLRAQPER